MSARVSTAFPLQVGDKGVKWDVYITTISDKLLLGINLLRHLGSVIDLEQNVAKMGDDVIHAIARKESGKAPYHISQLSLTEGVLLPPKSMLTVSVMSQSLTSTD